MNGKSNVHLVFKVGKGEISIGHDGQVDMSKVSDVKSEQLIIIGEFAGEFKRWLAEKGQAIMDKYGIKPAEGGPRPAPTPKNTRNKSNHPYSAKDAIVYEIFNERPHLVDASVIADKHEFACSGIAHYIKEFEKQFPRCIRVTHDPLRIGLALTNDPDDELIKLNKGARARIVPPSQTEA